ncbi:MAG: hypothetical protein N4A39_09155 [Roseicyclus sp.]|jgi:hypothetical protein|nr:hypothetical protein [Roseicyclus sp.]
MVRVTGHNIKSNRCDGRRRVARQGLNQYGLRHRFDGGKLFRYDDAERIAGDHD